VSEEDGKRLSQADRMLRLAGKEDTMLFTDQRGEPYLRAPMSEVYETMRLRSKKVRAWLAGLLWRAEEKAPNSEALASALNVLEAQAYDGPVIHLYNRVAPDDLGGIYIDMADPGWRAIHVTRDGWRIVDHPPVLFRRYTHQKPLPEPKPGGDPWELLSFTHIEEPGDRLLYVVTVISYLIPGIPHPIMVLHGPQGAGKTWTLRAARAVIDPSVLDLLTLPRQQRELVQNLDHHYCAFYDNVGPIPEWISNVLCRAVTGTGVSKRQLYTDDEDVIYEYRRCCGLTDINIAAERGDLLDRSILIGLEHLPERKRKTESELYAMLEEKAPGILGGILDTLVKALRIYPTIKLPGLFRMADYTKWGCAIAEALGVGRDEFLKAYGENIARQSIEAVRASPVADVLLRFMETRTSGTWSGTASQLYSELVEVAAEMKVSTRQKAWPKKPHTLMRRLNELAPSLPAVGYQIEKGRTKDRSRTRIITIKSVQSVNGLAAFLQGDGEVTPRKTPTSSVQTVQSVQKRPNQGQVDASDGVSGEDSAIRSEGAVDDADALDAKDASDNICKSFSGYEPRQLPSLTDATQALLTEFRKVSGGFASTDYLASLTGWPPDYTERVLLILKRDRRVFMTPDGLWRLVKP